MFDVYGKCLSLIRRRLPVGGPPFNVCLMLNRCFSASFVVELFWPYGSECRNAIIPVANSWFC